MILKNGAGLGITWLTVYAVLGWFTGWMLVAGLVSMLEATPDKPCDDAVKDDEPATDPAVDKLIVPAENPSITRDKR